MAFLIEKLSQKQREWFEMKQIRNPLSLVLGILKPSEWITDIEKDVFLFSIGVHRDYPNEELFFFHWRGMEFILPLKKENKLPNTRIWSLDTSWNNPMKNIQSDMRSQVIINLKEALDIYRVDGTSDPDNLSVQILYDF